MRTLFYKRRYRAAALAGAAMLLLFSAAARARQMDDMGIAVLRTIDKLSARTSTFDVPVDKTVKFGKSLFIKVRACRKASPLDAPESAAFLQIWEKKPGAEESTWVFSGWMFASKPSVSAMEHPVYDVWVIDCKDAAKAKEAAPFSTEAAPAASSMPATPAPASAPVVETPATATPKAAETPPEAKKPVPAPSGLKEDLENAGGGASDGEDAVAAPDDETAGEAPDGETPAGETPDADKKKD